MEHSAFQVLNRVGTAMGAREGTGPDDDPFLRRQRGESRAEGWVQGRTLGRTEGHAEGWAQGRAEGHAGGQAKGLDEGRKEGMRAAVLQVFESRGIPVSASLPERLAEMEDVSAAALAHAAMACREEEGFSAAGPEAVAGRLPAERRLIRPGTDRRFERG